MANSDGGTAAATMEAEFISLDMVYEILSRVSVLSVLRLKSVCKLWCSVVEDPYFIDMHLERSKSRVPKIILHAEITVFDDRWHGENSITFLGHRWLPKLTLRSPYTESCSHNTRPCNGLICLYNNDSTDIRLCNPATRELQVLPNPIGGSGQFCCLGFVPTTKEYKVLRFFRIDSLTSGHHHGCEVLTVGSSSWRRVGELYCKTKGKGVNLDGGIYLIALMSSDWDAYLIRFDLSTEDLDMVKLPDFVQYNVRSCQLLDLVLRGGKLCLIKRIYPGRLFALTLQGDYKNNIWDRDVYTMEGELARKRAFFDSASFVGEKGLLYRRHCKIYFRPARRASHLCLDDEVYESYEDVTDVYEFNESLVPLEKSAMLVESQVHGGRRRQSKRRTVRV